jgi:hypothetical protein
VGTNASSNRAQRPRKRDKAKSTSRHACREHRGLGHADDRKVEQFLAANSPGSPKAAMIAPSNSRWHSASISSATAPPIWASARVDM